MKPASPEALQIAALGIAGAADLDSEHTVLAADGLDGAEPEGMTMTR